MKAKEKIIDFEDNSVLQVVVGPQNENLKTIEKKIDVNLKHKGNQIVVIGKEKYIAMAVNVLESLYKKAKHGNDLENADISAAIRIALGSDDMVQSTEVQENRDLVLKTKKRHINPRSKTQAEFIDAMNKYEMVFGLGPAGTGKTYLAVAKAVSMMMEGKIDRIILSRPAVEAGENLGFLPGDLKDKIDPYLRPLYDALYEMLPQDQVDKKIETGEIEIAPLAFMRGRTLANSMVILDEAQNTTPMQMKMFLTRLGENSCMVVNGDLSQIDLPRGVESGLAQAYKILRSIKDIGFVEFTEADVVRHGLVSAVIRAYDAQSKKDRGDN